MNFKNKKTNFLSILGLIVFITIFLFALVALFRFNNSKSMVIKGNENVITFDIMSENDRKDIFNIYWEIEEVFTNDDDANKINIIVNNNNPLYLYVENGTIKQGDVIYVPKIKDTPFEISLEYIEEDTSEETIEYINSRYDGKCKSLVMKYANLSDIIADDVNIESHEFDKENPVNFHWTQIGSKSFENEKIALNGIVTSVNAASLEGYISNKENKQFTDKGEFIYNSYFNKIGFEVDMGKELDIIFSLNDAIIDDFDGKEATENDRLILDGELKLLNIKPDFNFEWDFDSDEPLKNLKAKVSYELETSLKSTFGGEQIDLYEALTSFREVNEDKFDNKIFGKIGGIDFDKKIVLGAVGLNIGLGKTTIGLKNMQNEQILTPFQPIVILMLTIDVDGTISAELVTELQYKTIVESGYCIAKNNDDGIKLCDYNEKIDSKHSYLFKKYKYESKENDGTGLSAKFEAGGKVNADAGLNASVGAMILGIIPASANAGIDIGMNGSLYGVVDTESIDESGIKANASFYVKFIADAEAKIVWNKNDKTEIGLDLNIPIYEKYLFKKEISNYEDLGLKMIYWNDRLYIDSGEIYSGDDIDLNNKIEYTVESDEIPYKNGQSNFGKTKFTFIENYSEKDLEKYDHTSHISYDNHHNIVYDWGDIQYVIEKKSIIYALIDDKYRVFKESLMLSIHDVDYMQENEDNFNSKIAWNHFLHGTTGIAYGYDFSNYLYPVSGTNYAIGIEGCNYNLVYYNKPCELWIEDLSKSFLNNENRNIKYGDLEIKGDSKQSIFQKIETMGKENKTVESKNLIKNIKNIDEKEYIKKLNNTVNNILTDPCLTSKEYCKFFTAFKKTPLFTILKYNRNTNSNTLTTVLKLNKIEQGGRLDYYENSLLVIEFDNITENSTFNSYDHLFVPKTYIEKYENIENYMKSKEAQDFFEKESNDADGKVGSYIIHNEY